MEKSVMKVYVLFQVFVLNFVITINAMDIKKKTEELESQLGMVELYYKETLQIIIKNSTSFEFFMKVKDQNNKDLIDVKDCFGITKKNYKNIDSAMQMSTLLPIKDLQWPVTIELLVAGAIIKKTFEPQEANLRFTIIAKDLSSYFDQRKMPSYKQYRLGLMDDETKQIEWNRSQ